MSPFLFHSPSVRILFGKLVELVTVNTLVLEIQKNFQNFEAEEKCRGA